MKQLLVCNVCGDESIALVNQFIMKEKTKEVIKGVQEAAKEIDADVLYLLPIGYQVEGLDEKIAYGQQSVVTMNPYAVVQELKGNLPRPMIGDDFVAIYKEQQISVISPEEAYRKATQKKVKFICVRQGDEITYVEANENSQFSEFINLDGAKGFLVGGLRGRFFKGDQLKDKTINLDSSCDSIIRYETSQCMVDVMVKLTQEAQMASCGKCVLCREGTLQYKTIVGEMTQGKARIGDIELIKETAELIKLGAYCDFGKKMVGPIVSALDLFLDEFEEHIKKKSCRNGVCYKGEAIYIILPDLCIGCGDCVDECEEDAIIGKAKFIHMIDQDMCENCGKCVPACEEEAIVICEGKLPKLPKKLTKVGKF